MSKLEDYIRSAARKRNARNRLKRPAAETTFGFWLSGPREMQTGTFEPDDVELVQNILKHTSLFINVGANIGYYCCFAQSRGIKTYAFEPNLINATILMKNMRRNGWGENITILPVAVGERAGVMDMFGEGTGASLVKGWARNPESSAREVAVVRLDDVIVDHQKEDVFILMDVEGFELFALRGAKSLVEADRKPIWLIEVNITEHQPDGLKVNPTCAETFETMKLAGYEVYETGPSINKIDWDQIEKACSGGEAEFSSHNFLFVEKGRDLRDLRLALS